MSHPYVAYRSVLFSTVFLFLGVTLSACDLLAQDESAVMNYIDVEQKPAPVGGFEALAAAARYPEIARKAGVEGTVLIRILVDEQGDVVPPGAHNDYGVMQGIGAGCDEEALRIVKKFKFIPGRHQGQRVPVEMYIAFNFDYRGPSISAESRSDLLDYTDVAIKPMPERGFEFLAASMKCSLTDRKAAEGTLPSYILVDKQGKGHLSNSKGSVWKKCHEEARNIIRTAEYIPGRHKGERVSVMMCVAFTFDSRGAVSAALCDEQP